MNWRKWKAILFGKSNPEMTSEQAYLYGLNEGIGQAASLIEEIGSETAKPLAVLIRGIGTAKVDENGKRLESE